MSNTPPMHLNWETVEMEQVTPGMSRKIISSERMTVARIYLKDGFLVPLHSHENEQVSQVISGTLRFRFGADRSQVIDVGPGEVVVIPPNLPHEALSIGDVEEFDTWAPVRSDWLDGTDDYLRKATTPASQ